MRLEKIADAQAAGSEEECLKILKENMYPGEISEDKLKEVLQGIQEELGPEKDITVSNEEERKLRKERSQKLRDKITQIAIEGQKTNQKRKEEEQKEQKPIQLNRELSSDTILRLPHESQNDLYKERYQTLAYGTPEAKANLVMKTMREAKKGYSPDKLAKLTDEEIVDDFENLERLQGFVNSVVNILGDSSIEFSEAQKKELQDFEREFAVMSWIHNRANVISNPFYGNFRLEDISYLENIDFYEGDYTDQEEEKTALKDVVNTVDDMQKMLTVYFRAEMIKKLENFPINEVTWMTENGQKIETWYNPKLLGDKGDYELRSYDSLMGGKTLTAILPNGKVKVFSQKTLEGGGIEFQTDTLETKIDIDGKISDELKTLESGLDKADPWYIRSSGEFKDVQKALKALQSGWPDMGENPTKEQSNKIQEQIGQLQEKCSTYLTNKQKKMNGREPNNLETRRMAAVQKILDFAKKQRNLERSTEKTEEKAAFQSEPIAEEASEKENDFLTEALQDEIEKTEEKAAFQSEPIAEEASEKENDFLTEALQNETEKSIERSTEKTQDKHEEKVIDPEKKYANVKLQSGSSEELKNLQKKVVSSLGRLDGAAHNVGIRSGMREILLEDMAKVIAFEMILREQAGRKETDATGRLEEALNKKGLKAFVKNIREEAQNMESFPKNSDEVTPERIVQFITKNEADKVCSELIKNAKKEKQVQKTEPSAQKKKTNEMQM